MRSPTAAAWTENILGQLYHYWMADQIISTSVSFEKTVDSLWVSLAVRMEDLLPHAAVGRDLAGRQDGNASTSAE